METVKDWISTGSGTLVAIGFVLLLGACGSTEVRKAPEKEEITSMPSLSARVETAVGRSMSARLLRERMISSDKKRTKYLNHVGKLLASHRTRREIDSYQFGLLNDKERSTFSAPGGYVFITRGMLEVCEDESELAGLIAHEIAHVEYQHLLKSVEDALRSRDTFPEDASDLADLGSVMRDLPAGTKSFRRFLSSVTRVGVNLMLSEGFTLEQERQADRHAVDLLAKAGYDPAGLQRVLKRIKRLTEGRPDYVHPLTDERLQLLSTYLRGVNVDDSGRRVRRRFEKLGLYGN